METFEHNDSDFCILSPSEVLHGSANSGIDPIIDQLDDLTMSKIKLSDNLSEMSKKCDVRFNELQTAISNLRIELIEKIEAVRAPENIEIKPVEINDCVEKLEKHVNLSELAKAVHSTITAEFDLPLMDNGKMVESITNTKDFLAFIVDLVNSTRTSLTQNNLRLLDSFKGLSQLLDKKDDMIKKNEAETKLQNEKILMLESENYSYAEELEHEKCTNKLLSDDFQILQNDLKYLHVRNEELLAKIERLHNENNSCPFCNMRFQDYAEVVQHVKKCRKNRE